jgi:hypothetical protein
MDRPIQPNEKCPCKSGKKYKKCCYLRDLIGTPSPEEKIPETPEEIAAFNAEFDRLLGWFVQTQKEPEFVEFMHEEKDAASWHINDEEGLVLVPYPPAIQAMRDKERAALKRAS